MAVKDHKLNIACVEYYNTLPFLLGLSHHLDTSVEYDLYLAPPSQCTHLYRSGQADIALVPVGGLDTLPNDYRILDQTCIGCNGAVDTVAILSQVPITQVTDLYLDPHSNRRRKQQWPKS